MMLASFRQIQEVVTLSDLRQQLSRRHQGDHGSFWLWHSSGAELAFMVTGDDAHLCYISADGNLQHSTIEVVTHANEARTYVGGAGPSLYQSRSSSPDADATGDCVDFLADNYEQTPVLKRYTIPFPQALIAVDEFFVSGQRSSTIEWELIEAPTVPPPQKRWWQFWR